jgi:hypothetical protein
MWITARSSCGERPYARMNDSCRLFAAESAGRASARRQRRYRASVRRKGTIYSSCRLRGRIRFHRRSEGSRLVSQAPMRGGVRGRLVGTRMCGDRRLAPVRHSNTGKLLIDQGTEQSRPSQVDPGRRPKGLLSRRCERAARPGGQGRTRRAVWPTGRRFESYISGAHGRPEYRPNRYDNRAGQSKKKEALAANGVDDKWHRPRLQLLPLHTPSKWPVISETPTSMLTESKANTTLRDRRWA